MVSSQPVYVGDVMSAKRPGKFVVFRVGPEEKKLLQSLGQGPGEKDRYTALSAFVELAGKITFSKPKKEIRKPVRVRMPPDLAKVLKKISKQTGQPALLVLLELAREFRLRNPFPRRPSPSIGRS
jgi:hypothetical protein